MESHSRRASLVGLQAQPKLPSLPNADSGNREGAFAPENLTYEALGNDPTSGDPRRVSRAAFSEGFPNTTFAADTNAAYFMVQQVRKYPGEVSIYAGGALTNIALAVRMDPDFASLAKELIIMGGYLDVNLLQTTGSVMQADINGDVGLLALPSRACLDGGVGVLRS